MGYPTTATLVGASDVEALANLSTGEQDNLRAAAIRAVEGYCRQSFEDEPNVARTVSGTGKPYLLLPKRLYNVDAVTVNGATLAVGDLDLTERKNKLFFKSLVGSNYYTRTLAELDNEFRGFRYGEGNITITGDWGWPDSPEAVDIAIRYDMEDAALADLSGLGPTIGAYRKLGLKDVRQGDLAVTMGEAVGLSDRARLLLTEAYIWRAPVGSVA